MDHERALSQVVRWAEGQPGIRGVVLTGSAAVGPEAMDSLSDLDVELYVADPSRFLDDDAWYARFGDVLVVEALDNPGWHPTRLVYYVGGKIDFLIAPAEELPAARSARPLRVLLDKDGLAAGLRGGHGAEPGLPEPADFRRCNEWFHAAALMCARAVARGEPWQAKVRDWDAKQQLLQMLEWDHRARHGWSYETWHGGKHLDRWVDGDIRARLDACWAGFAVGATAKALLATFDLFEMLSRRTAGALGLDAFDAARVRSEVMAIMGDA